MRRPGLGLAGTLLACLVSATLLQADAGLPIVSAAEDDDYSVMRFDNLADFPDFHFYLKYASGSGAPSPHLLPVQQAEPMRLEGGRRRLQVVLLAVPRHQPPPSSLWHGGVPEGCLESEPLEGALRGTGHLVSYRIQIEDDRLIATVQSSEWLAGEWSLFWLKRLPCIAVPVGFCAALGWLGARLARQLFPAKPGRHQRTESLS